MQLGDMNNNSNNVAVEGGRGAHSVSAENSSHARKEMLAANRLKEKNIRLRKKQLDHDIKTTIMYLTQQNRQLYAENDMLRNMIVARQQEFSLQNSLNQLQYSVGGPAGAGGETQGNQQQSSPPMVAEGGEAAELLPAEAVPGIALEENEGSTAADIASDACTAATMSAAAAAQRDSVSSAAAVAQRDSVSGSSINNSPSQVPQPPPIEYSQVAALPPAVQLHSSFLSANDGSGAAASQQQQQVQSQQQQPNK
jgi:hypothetical protein